MGNKTKVNKVKGYKVFNPNWTCRDFQYKVGETYEMEEEIEVCYNGFHFCKKASSCFNYYCFDPANKVAEVVALGQVKTDGNKSCTNKIKIVRELSWAEVLELVNTGEGNKGLNNTGDLNAGNNNTGDKNKGNRNTGDSNTGDRNTGDRNTGDRNTGRTNSGGRNSGHGNIGYANTGNQNIGDFNTGGLNTGHDNSGYCNRGNKNTGHNNKGNNNTGDWNTSNQNVGCFNTENNQQKYIQMFNKPTNWTLAKWQNSRAREILNSLPDIKWKRYEEMSEKEKTEYPESKTTGGILISQKNKDKQKWWDKLLEKDKQIVKSLPNFDADVFYQCTGIKVE